jgi:uncharacterized membrane protein YfcA
LELFTSGLLQTAILGVAVFIAGVVRGCIGFGFSALVVASTSLFLNPADLVPMVVLLEIVASLQMVIRVWRDVLRDLVVVLSIGVLLGTPVGVYFLSIAEPDALRLALSIMILAMTVILSVGYIYTGPMNRSVLASVGAVSGIFNGIAGIGGMPVAIFLASAKFPIRRIRGSMVIFLLVTELIFLASAFASELYRWSIVNTSILACVPMGAGLITGSWMYGKLDERMLRRIFVSILMVLSIIGVVRAMVS